MRNSAASTFELAARPATREKWIMSAAAQPWRFDSTIERVELDTQGTAEVTFSIVNDGPVDQRLVLDVMPGENTDRSWFRVTEPQRVVPHGQQVELPVSVSA